MRININKFHLLSFLGASILLSSCTKTFEDINTDKTKLVVLKGKQLDKLFTTAEYLGVYNDGGGAYQLLQSLYTDAQAQFFACTQPNFPSDRNVMVGRWINGGWGPFLSGATTLAEILKQTGPTSEAPNPVREAVAKIWKVYMYLPITDMFGPIPYSEVGSGKLSIAYDTQESIYADFFTSLADATQVISQNLDRGKVFEEGDVIYGGDLAKWLKLGNSLRLRLAIRISLKDPAKAKTEGEAAVAMDGGMITVNADNAFMQTTAPTYPNPLGVISDWGEFRMSGAMQSILQGYQDPRMPKFFEPTENNPAVFKGIHNGLTKEEMSLSGNSNENNSNIVSRFRNASMATEPIGLMMAAETWFNMAEGALNGWNMGSLTAKECYENGISASMSQWGIDGGATVTYLASANTPVALGDIYNTPALSDIPVAFGATEAVQREQIGTQKWLGLFPYSSPEAWAEFRRSGFPKLYPRLHNDNPDASLEANSVKRLIFPPDEAIINAAGYQTGVDALGGPDKTSTKLWWNP